MSQPFYFSSRLNQTILLGRKAANIQELLAGIKEVPGSSIYYHTHRFLQQHHFLSPEPPNDFAYWITNSLNNDILGEKIASVDLIQFQKIAELRISFIEIIEDYLQTGGPSEQHCPSGEEFQFMSGKTFIFPTGYVANNLAEFCDILRKISIHSIYFHMFEARLRLEQPTNDFSLWLSNNGYPELAQKINHLDPYTCTLENLRHQIIRIIENGSK